MDEGLIPSKYGGLVVRNLAGLIGCADPQARGG